jgi:hypothetical protein
MMTSHLFRTLAYNEEHRDVKFSGPIRNVETEA